MGSLWFKVMGGTYIALNKLLTTFKSVMWAAFMTMLGCRLFLIRCREFFVCKLQLSGVGEARREHCLSLKQSIMKLLRQWLESLDLHTNMCVLLRHVHFLAKDLTTG